MEEKMKINPNDPSQNKDLSWLDTEIKRYRERRTMVPEVQIKLYKAITDHFVNGRTVIDVGSCMGFGSNILSHRARHVWGIDFNQEALDFANHMFARPNLSFDYYDIEKPTTRPLSHFDIVVMSEVIEHLTDPEKGLDTIKRFFSDKIHTIGFITAPNINNLEVREIDANNKLHLHHWTAGDFYALLIKHFRSVTLYGSESLNQWEFDETVDGNHLERLTIAKVEGVI
jgi:2-polyprenyl-3-methyl-5-hydroxy-6-metoxy-1,4-benzoquinol methylase